MRLIRRIDDLKNKMACYRLVKEASLQGGNRSVHIARHSICLTNGLMGVLPSTPVCRRCDTNHCHIFLSHTTQ